ncbi:hypothetical protein B0187_08810 [Haemophilus paracuniculus]|uniref:Uncharacterized protein n=1 Tax=Haemophilus paracuniculus TaxID=734 RepID=A0A1T0AQ29_9PAST|nr:hypothetical protein B0187_08810 [Haemophilus paracuniculus]
MSVLEQQNERKRNQNCERDHVFGRIGKKKRNTRGGILENFCDRDRLIEIAIRPQPFFQIK